MQFISFIFSKSIIMNLWIIIIAPAFFIYENIIEYGERRDDSRNSEQLRKNAEIFEEARRFLVSVAPYRFSLKVIIANEESNGRFCRGSGVTLSAGIDWTDNHGRQLFGHVDHSRNVDPFPDYYTPFQSFRNICASRALRDMKRDASAMSKWKSWRCADTTIKDHRPCISIVRTLSIRWTCLLSNSRI